MSTFSDIYGYDTIKEHLQNAIKLDKVSHAYIINGGLGAGKKMIAKIFAKHYSVRQKAIISLVINVIPVYRQSQAISLI